METVLTRRSLPQPKPALSPGGDCAACVTGGLLGLSAVQEVYDLFSDGTPEATTWGTARDRLWEAKSFGMLDRYIDVVPQWSLAFDGRKTWGSPSWEQCIEWFGYVTLAMDAGYYAVTSINYAGEGPFSETDHSILLCGVRDRKEPVFHNEKKIADKVIQEVLVSCSSKGEYWIDARDLLERHGGFNVLLARPVER